MNYPSWECLVETRFTAPKNYSFIYMGQVYRTCKDETVFIPEYTPDSDSTLFKIIK